VATAGITTIIFTDTWAGLSFLNSATREDSQKHSSLTKKIDSMSTESLKKLLTATKARKAA